MDSYHFNFGAVLDGNLLFHFADDLVYSKTDTSFYLASVFALLCLLRLDSKHAHAHAHIHIYIYISFLVFLLALYRVASSHVSVGRPDYSHSGSVLQPDGV